MKQIIPIPLDKSKFNGEAQLVTIPEGGKFIGAQIQQDTLFALIWGYPTSPISVMMPLYVYANGISVPDGLVPVGVANYNDNSQFLGVFALPPQD
jgi:hypothetical protein